MPVPNPFPPEEQRTLSRGPSGSSFVPGLVHELRNFIFGISGSLDAMQARLGHLEEAARYNAVMQDSLERLNGFLDELADYGDPRSQARAGASLEMMLREALELHRPRAAQAGVELRLELAGRLPPVLADEQALCRAFSGLIGLALCGQGRGGRVTLAAAAGTREDRPVIRGWVESPGLELPGVDLSRLFEPFYYRASGFGRLALPVARRVLESHGGSLAAAPNPGGGVRMAFTLPAL